MASSLSAGRPATIRVRPKGVAVCRLQLPVGQASRTASTIELASGDEVTWRWQVPLDAARAKWTAWIGCWDSSDAVGRQAADTERRVELEVRGTGGLRQVVLPETLAAAVKKGDDRSTLEKATNWSAIVGAFLGLFTLGFIARTLRVTRVGARAERTTRLLERINNHDMLERWSTVLLVIKVTGEAACLDRVRRVIAVPTANDRLLSPSFALFSAPSASRPRDHQESDRSHEPSQSPSLNDVLGFINFYEEVGLLYNKRLIDRKLLDRGFGSQMIQGFYRYWWWVEYQREGKPAAACPERARPHESELFADWERMVRRILRKRPDYPMPTGAPVRSLCLPAKAEDKGKEQPTAADWRNYESLSVAVGRLLRCRQGLDRLQEHLRNEEKSTKGSADAGLTICIPDSGEIQPQPWLWRRMLRRLGARLNRERLVTRLVRRLVARLEPQGTPEQAAPVRRAVHHLGAWLNREHEPGPVCRLGERLECVDHQVKRFLSHQKASDLLLARRSAGGPEGVMELSGELDEIATELEQSEGANGQAQSGG